MESAGLYTAGRSSRPVAGLPKFAHASRIAPDRQYKNAEESEFRRVAGRHRSRGFDLNNPKPSGKNSAPAERTPVASNFIRTIVDEDLATGKYAAAHLGRQARPGERCTPARRRTRRGSARAFRRSRTATCTSATPSRSASTSGSRATTAARATCASTTPTRRRKSRSTSTRSSTRCAGSASTGGRICSTRPTTSIFCTVRRGLHPARPRLRRRPDRRRDARATAAR